MCGILCVASISGNVKDVGVDIICVALAALAIVYVLLAATVTEVVILVTCIVVTLVFTLLVVVNVVIAFETAFVTGVRKVIPAASLYLIFGTVGVVVLLTVTVVVALLPT
jgi:hypothetical protein